MPFAWPEAFLSLLSPDHQELAKQPKLRMKLALKVEKMIEVLGAACVTITYPTPAEEVQKRIEDGGEGDAEIAEGEQVDHEGNAQMIKGRQNKNAEETSDESSQPIERCLDSLHVE